MLSRFFLVLYAITGVPLLIAWIVARGVLHPKAKLEDHTLADFDLPAEPVVFPGADGTKLAGWFIPADTGSLSPTIVLVHGWSRSRAELLPHADLLHRAGFSVLTFDQRNRGESEGDMVTLGVREQLDLSGAIDYVLTRPEVDPKRIGTLGLSTGGVVSLMVASRDKRVRALVVESPFASLDTIMSKSLSHYYHLPTFPIAHLARILMERQIGASMNAVSPLHAVGEMTDRPVFFIADGADAVVGAEEALHLFDAAGEQRRYWLIEGANHACGWQAAPKEYEQRVVDFFWETLGADVPVPSHMTQSSER